MEMQKSDTSEFLAGSTGFLVNQLARLMTQVLAKAIRPLNIAPAQFTILLLLWQRDGQSQSELLTEVKVEQSTIAVTLSRMERDGLIVRRPNPDDNRSRLVLLTKKGHALKAPALNAGRIVNRLTLADISIPDQERLIKHLKRAIANARNAL